MLGSRIFRKFRNEAKEPVIIKSHMLRTVSKGAPRKHVEHDFMWKLNYILPLHGGLRAFATCSDSKL